MNKKPPVDELLEQAMTSCFGGLSLTMLNDSELKHAWRINFLANFFVGPVYKELAEKYDLSRPEFVILYCLKNQPGLVARDICRVTGLPKNSISRAVTALLKNGLVLRQTGDEDRREKPLEITQSGDAKVNDGLRLFSKRQENMRESLTEEELDTFDGLLLKIIYSMPAWTEMD